jgi:hypothetical protein
MHSYALRQSKASQVSKVSKLSKRQKAVPMSSLFRTELETVKQQNMRKQSHDISANNGTAMAMMNKTAGYGRWTKTHNKVGGEALREQDMAEDNQKSGGLTFKIDPQASEG